MLELAAAKVAANRSAAFGPLGMLARWASTNHPDDDLWHLLTDCFPSPGTVGIASKGGLCQAPGQRTSFVATTIDPDPSDNLTLVQRLDACDRQGYP